MNAQPSMFEEPETEAHSPKPEGDEPKTCDVCGRTPVHHERGAFSQGHEFTRKRRR